MGKHGLMQTSKLTRSPYPSPLSAPSRPDRFEIIVLELLEQILSEIETQLRASDPDLAHQVGSTTVYTDSLRKLRWGIVAFIAGLVLAVVLLSVNFVLAFVVGFLGMVASALFIERNARRLGRAGINEATQAMRGGSLRAYFDRAGQKARDRMRRNDDER